MRMARPLVTTRLPRAAIFAACALAVAIEVYLVGVYPYGRTTAHGRDEMLLTSFGEGEPVAQEFTAEADGLHAIDVTVHAPQPADVELHWRVSQLQDGQWRERRAGALGAARLEGARVLRLTFAPIEHSAGTAILVELTATRAPVALVASRDKPLRFSYLTVGGREQWGDLVFDTRADTDTLWGRLRALIVPGAPTVRGSVLLAIVLGLLNLLAILFLQQLLSAERDTTPPIAVRPQPARMARVGTAGAAIVLVAATTGGMWAGVPTQVAYDLYTHFDDATLQTGWPLHDAFDLVEMQIDWWRRHAIRAVAPSTISWHLTVPANARLQTSLALDPDAWDHSDDGAIFVVRVVQGGITTELLRRLVDPRHVPADRHWIPVDIDLSRFAGRWIALELTTEPSLPGHPIDAAYDWAVWGTPRVVDGRLAGFDPDRLTAVN